MNALVNVASDPQLEWLYHIGPIGLVIGPNVIRQEDLIPPPQHALDTAQVAALQSADDEGPALTEPWPFFEQVLGWEARYVAGSPRGPALENDLVTKVDEHDLVLAPDWAVRELSEAGGYQVLVKLHLDLNADDRAVLPGWEATPHQQMERLLRETGVSIGVLVDRKYIRIVYAPRGETSGWLSFPIRSVGSVAGRAMLGGLKLMLGRARLFTEPEPRRLPKLLARSREEQNQVSTKLAEQVLGALHELLRAFHAADPERITNLAARSPHLLYEGLLTTLMRLVFLLYAEDRELIPNIRTGQSIEIYEHGYSVRGLYAKLAEDRALNPDTMDERLGGWGRLLALFRLVHGGHPSGWITARGGKLFDPDAFPFLEGRDAGEPLSAARTLPIRDGALLRILEGLMTLEARSITGDWVRERLSYRSLDVEQIGSVYETIMGFTVEVADGPSLAIKAGKNNRTPVFVNLEKLADAKGKDRVKFLKEEAGRGQLSAGVAKAIENAKTVDQLAAALDPIVDERASPKKHLTAKESPILQPTDERRRTGSHYTPRSLTEPIVRHALEPTFERLGADATPDQILDLKVCDPAMGSGAFLVEACRQLGDRLVKAWARHRNAPAPPEDETLDLHARRLVAQRCLYGIDKNPLATDLAKLSLWLATLARDHEFTFLDHALKSGDSLVGLTQTQIAAANWDTSKPSLPLFRQLAKDRVAEVMKGRAEIQAAPDDTTRAIQEARHLSLEERIKEIRLIGDAVIAAFFVEDKPKARERKRAEVESWLGGSPVVWDKLAAMAATLKQGTHPLAPFHWEIEFPEVFLRDNAGFDAIVGNPPFLGGTRISTGLGGEYRDWLKNVFGESGNRMDLVAYFFRRAFTLVRLNGAFGLIGTNTIAQGDTRTGGLGWIARHNGFLFAAQRRKRWPGLASVMISIVHVLKGDKPQKCLLDNREVEKITAFLVDRGNSDEPQQLGINSGISHSGVKTYGQGFLFADDDGKATPLAEMWALVANDPTNNERIRPYLGGEGVNDDPTHRPHRFAIDFTGLTERQAQQWPSLFEILRKKIPEERKAAPAAVRRSPFWLYWNSRAKLRDWCDKHERFLARSETSKHHALAFLQTSVLPSQKLVCFCFDTAAAFAALQSRVHETWILFFGSTLEDRPVYSQSDCFETYPLPKTLKNAEQLEAVGKRYYEQRAALMTERNEGMTKTYNRFHDRTETAEDIQRLRDLHAAMDRAVLEAYGWHDLAERAEPVFLDETNEDDHTYQGRLFWPSDFRDEVLARLLALNAERHAEEVRLGVAPGMKGGNSEDEGDDADPDTG